MFGFETKHWGFVVDGCFLLNFFFGLIFLGAAYSHNGDGVVRFQNIHHDDITESDQDNTFKALYVGWDQACRYVAADGDKLPHNDCFTFQPMEDRELNVLVPITWVLIMFGIAHFLLKRIYIRSGSFRDILNMDALKVIVMILLFYGPIVLFIFSMIYWSWFTERSDTIAPISDNAETFPKDSEHVDLNLFNGEANPYKKTQFLAAGSTWSVILLLVGQFLQTIACIIAIVRNVAHDSASGSTFIGKFFFMGQEGFVGNNGANLTSPIATPVDAAAKNPETKAAAQAQVTSVYANRRVTNGISF